MGLFNFQMKSLITINSDLMDYHSLVTNHYNTVPNVHGLYQEVYSTKFWDYIKTKFIIKPENVIVRTDMNIDVKNREQKMYSYFIHIEEPDIFMEFYDEEKNYDDNDYFDLVDELDRMNMITGLKIYYKHDSTSIVNDEIIPELKSIIHNTTIKNQFFVISASEKGGFELSGHYIRKMDIDVELNYGAEFYKKYPHILDSLKNNKSGLYLFHGESGTGKTTFIRKLISELSESKTFIYIPSYLMYELANPELISFISKYRDSILILEDAENVLTSVVDDRTQAIANILNISDGLLNDAINIQIIATFNVDKKIIDKALTRPGRLKVNHKFKKLTADEANKLAVKLNINKTYSEPITVASVYEKPSNNLVESNDNETNSTGFKFGNKK